MIQYVWLIPLFPALAVVVNAFLGHRLKERCHWLAVGSVGLSFLVATAVFIDVVAGHTGEVVLFDWITAYYFQVQFAFLVDQLSAVMLMVVTGVGFLIHLYAVGYMHRDPGYFRFFTYLNLFMVSMLILVLGNSFALMFIGWEGVGLCSYLLIGYYYTRHSATTAGNKAFIVNRIGDAGFLMGIFTIYTTFGSLRYADVLPYAGEITTGVATVICIALFVGAMGKSAQIPLYVWLPDAMEGPTPVSALIHAATMVTAGVYMVSRASALYLQAPAALALVAVVGAATAIFSASIGLVQNDFKRVLAYSTVSQLGYMFLACGVGAFAAGIFHLMTHAFFKALLFLAAGSVLHALHHEGNIQVMGGLKKYMPRTYWPFLAACLAIAGIPGFAGFFSKDEILWQAFSSSHGHWALWLIGALAAGMTAFYMFRLLFMVFHGECRYFAYSAAHGHGHGHRDEEQGHHTPTEIHESPHVMTLPLAVLGVLSVVGGYIGVPEALGGSNWFHHFLSPALGGGAQEAGHEAARGGLVAVAHAASEAAHGAAQGAAAHPSVFMEYLLMAASVAIALCGIALAYHFYIRDPEAPKRLAERFRLIYKTLFNKYYVDELYGLIFVRHCLWWARASWRVDETCVDGMVNGSGWTTVLGSRLSGLFDITWVDGAVDGIGQIIQGGAKNFRILQTGYVQNYALAMLVAVFAMVSVYLFF